MNARVTTSVLAAAIGMWFVPAEAGETSLPPLTILLQPAKTATGHKHARLLGDLIAHYLMKNKLPTWEFLDPGNVSDFKKMVKAAGGNPSDATQVARMMEADVLIEYTGKALPPENARVTISARESLRGHPMFSFSASGKTALDDLLPKVLAELKEHHFDLAKNGTWYRILLLKAPKGLVAAVDGRLKKSCHKTERPPSGPGIYAQCKLSSLELADLVDKIIRSRHPKVKYEFVAKTSWRVEIKFF